MVCAAVVCFAAGATAEPPHAEPFTNSIGMKLVVVSAGEFLMGQEGPQREYNKNGEWFQTASTRFDEADWDERPVHTVVIVKRSRRNSSFVRP
jgi:formylglycine-generating enzyme required for sulfatase activity